MKTKSIAVDFDGTKKGIKLILWTCRNGQTLDAAVAFCKQYGLVFDSVSQRLGTKVPSL